MRVAGIGFRTATPPAALRAALAAAGVVDRVATLRAKAAELGAALPGIPVAGVAVAGVVTPTRSVRVEALFGTGSVAEAAALVAAGSGARLVRQREVIGGVTLAVAEGDGE